MFKTNTERSRSSLRTGAGFGVRNEHGALRKSEANTDGSSSQHPRCTPAAPPLHFCYRSRCSLRTRAPFPRRTSSWKVRSDTRKPCKSGMRIKRHPADKGNHRQGVESGETRKLRLTLTEEKNDYALVEAVVTFSSDSFAVPVFVSDTGLDSEAGAASVATPAATPLPVSVCCELGASAACAVFVADTGAGEEVASATVEATAAGAALSPLARVRRKSATIARRASSARRRRASARLPACARADWCIA